MKFIQNLTNKKVNLGKIELIYATTYLLAGKMLDIFVGRGIAFLTMNALMIIFTILLIVFFRQHVYGKDRPLLTALSIYYKSMAYVAVIFIMCSYPGKTIFMGAAMFVIIIYAVLSYIYGKKYDEMWNAYLYGVLIATARLCLF
jgi:hypothetical protein